MAKTPLYVAAPGRRRLGSVPAWQRRRRIVTAVLAVALIAFLLVAFLVIREAYPVLRGVLGLGFALLAVATVAVATHRGEDPEEILRRLRSEPQSNYGKQLRGRGRFARLVGIVRLDSGPARVAMQVIVGVVCFAWWFTPLSPVKVKQPVIEDLGAIFADDLVAGMLVLPDTRTAVVQPPVVPNRARQSASLIRGKAATLQLALRAVAEDRFDEARSLLDEIASAQPAEDAAMHVARAQLEMYAGRFEQAAQHYDDANKLKPDQPMALCQLAMAWIHAGEFAKAEPYVTRAAKIAPATDPARAAAVHVQCLVSVVSAKDIEEALKRTEQGRKICGEILSGEHTLVATGWNNQAVLYALQADYTNARELLKSAQDILDRNQEQLSKGSARQSPDPRTSIILCNRAAMNLSVADFAKADELITQGMADLEACLPKEHPLLAVPLNLQALLRRSRGDEQYPKAREPAEKALTCVQKGLGLNHALVVPVLDTLAAIDIDEGRYVKAAERCRQRQPVAEHVWGEEAVRQWGPGHGHAFLIEGLNFQARVRALMGKFGEAEDCVKQAQKMCEVSLGRKEHPSWASTLSTRGRLEIAWHKADGSRPSEARRPLESARKVLDNLFGKSNPDHPDLARTLGDLASLDSGPSTSTRGITLYERAILMLEKSCGDEHPDVARLYCGVALLHQEQKKWDDAAKKLDRALEIQHKMLRADHPDLATTLEAYAELLKNMKPANPDRAAELLAKAKEIRRDHAAKEAAAASGGT